MNNNGLSYLPFTGAYSISVDMSQAKTGERIYLPDTPVLSDKFITGMNIYWSYAGEVQSPDGNLIVENPLYDITLTLVDQSNTDFISGIPAIYFIFGGRQIVINKYLVLPNCYLINTSSTNANSLFITFYYTDKVERNDIKENESILIQSLSVPVYSGTYNKFYLPDNRVLAGKKIRNIYSTTFLSGASSPDNSNIVNPENAFLTLIYRSEIILYRIPVLYFSQWAYPFRLQMDNLHADLPTSYIELSNDIVQEVGNKVVFLNVEYTN